MKCVILLIIFFGSIQEGYCQKKNDSSYIKEIRAVERKIYLNVIYNVDSLLINDSLVYSGWIVVKKAANNTTKSYIVSNDLHLSEHFVFPKEYEIKVNWNKIDTQNDSILLIRKFVFGGLQANINDSIIRFKNDMELEMIQKKYLDHKIILLLPYKDKILNRVQ